EKQRGLTWLGFARRCQKYPQIPRRSPKRDNNAVLVIRNAQMDTFRDSREAECMASLEECLRHSFPFDFARLNSNELRTVIRLGMERSRSHGGRTTRDMYLYLTVMFMLGCYFVEDPKLAWVQQFLG